MGGNGYDSMGVGREWEQESHSRTRLMVCSETMTYCDAGVCQ